MTDSIPRDELVYGTVGGRTAFAEDIREVEGFGGLYHEDCDVVVLVTDSTEAIADRAVERYQPLLQSTSHGARCSGAVRVRKSSFAWQQLATWYHDRLRLRGLPGVTAHGISVVRNRIVIGADTRSSVAEIEQRIAAAGIPREAVLIGITGPVQQPPLTYRLVVESRSVDPPHNLYGATAVILRGEDTIAVTRTRTPGGTEVDLPGPGRYRVVLDEVPGYRLHPRQPDTVEINVDRLHPVPTAAFYLVPRPTPDVAPELP